MREADLCKEILSHAYQSRSSFPLLHALSSYDSVLQSHGLSPDSPLATNVYRVLLRWGRDQRLEWWKRFEEEFGEREKGLTVQDLEGSGKPGADSEDKPSDKAFFKPMASSIDENSKLQSFSFGLRPSDELRTQKFAPPSPPTKDSPLSLFSFSLPKFREFLRRNKALTDSQLIASAFRNNKESTAHKHFQEKVAEALSTKSRTSLVTKAWLEAATNSRQEKRAEGHWTEKMGRKVMQGWTQLSLMKFKSRLSKTLARKYVCQRHFRYWKRARDIGKLRAGLQFTAEFIHKQWLLKKSLLAFGRSLQSHLRLSIFERKLTLSRVKSTKTLIFTMWRVYYLQRAETKRMYLKGYQESYRIGLKLGWKRLKNGINIQNSERKMTQIAAEFHSKTAIPKSLKAVFRRFGRLLAIKQTRNSVISVYHRSLQRHFFTYLLHFSYSESTRTNAVIRAMAIRKQTNVLRSWHTVQSRAKVMITGTAPAFLLGCYKWISTYIACQKPTFSPNSTSSLSTDRKIGQNFEFPIVFQRDFGCDKSNITRAADCRLKAIIVTKIWKNWKRSAKIYHRKRRQFRETNVKPIFLAWKKRVHTSVWLRFQLSKYLSRKNSIKSLILLTVWQKHASTRRRITQTYNSTIRAKSESAVVRIWTHWRATFLTLSKHRSESRLSRNLFTGKYLGRALQTWRNRLAFRHKKHHLAHTCEKFSFSRLLTSSWRLWRRRYIAAVELDMTSEQIVSSKEAVLLGKLFAAWQRLVPMMRKNTYQRQMAGIKYNRKLAKRSVTALISYAAYARHKNSVYETARNRFRIVTQRNCLLALLFYSEFRSKQRAKDAEMVPKVKKAMKSLRFTQWYHCALLYSSCRYVPELVATLQKRHFLRRLEMNKDVQRLTDAYMRIHEERTMKCRVMTAWGKYVGKKAVLDENERKFRVRDRYFRRLIPFNTWKKAFSYERNIVKLGQMAIIRIKNDILTEVLRAWKLYRGYRLRKRYSGTHRDVSIVKQTMHAWRKLIAKKQVLKRIAAAAGSHIDLQSLSRVFYTWLAAAVKKQKCWFNYQQVVKVRTRKVIAIWGKELRWKSKKTEIQRKVTDFREEIAKKRVIQRLKMYSEQKSSISHYSNVAGNHYNARLLQIAFLILTKRREIGVKLTRATAKMTKSRCNKTVIRHFSAWKAAAEPAIQRVKSATVFKCIFLRGTMRIGVKLWVAGVKDMVATDRKAESSHFRTLKITTFKAFRAFIQSIASKRIKNAKIVSARNRIHLKSVLTRLQTNAIHQNELKSKQNVADLYHFDRIKQLSIAAWVKYVALNQDLRGKSTAAALFFMETRGPAIISAWKSVVSGVISKKKSRNRAMHHYAFVMLLKAINALKSHKNASIERKEATEIAKIAYSERLKEKYFNKLRVYRSAKVTEKGRRSHFSFQISENRSKNMLGKAFFALKNNQVANLGKIAEIQLISEKLNAKLVLKSWKCLVDFHQNDYQMIETVSKTIQKRTKLALFRYWRKARLEEFSLKKLKLRLKRKSLSRNFTEWRRQLAIKFINIRKEFALKLGSFRSMHKYSDTSLQAQSRLSHVRESIQFNFVRKLVSKWRKTHHSWKKTKLVKHSQKIRKLKLCWTQWRKSIEIRQKSVDFSISLSKRLQNRTFRKWQMALERQSTLISTLKVFLSAVSNQRKRAALGRWRGVTRDLTVWENVNRQIVEPAAVRRQSGAFLGWKYVLEQRKLLKNISGRYIEGRIYHRKRVIFDALSSIREGRLRTETVIISKENDHKARNKKRVVKAWLMLIKKTRTLGDLSDMTKRKSQRRYLRVFLGLWTNESRKITHLKSFKSALVSHLKARCYAVWRRKYIETTHQSLFSRVIARHGTKLRKIALALWRNSSIELRNLEKQADSLCIRREIRLKKQTLDQFSSLVHREKRNSSVEFHVKMSRVKRVFQLFSFGCRQSQQRAVNNTYASDHHSKRLLLSSLVAWRVWMQQRFEAHVEADSDYLRAHQHNCRQLLAKSFVGWASETRERAYIQERSVLYAIFSAWKVHTRENLLLKKYLQECNLSERFMRSSRDVHDTSRSSVFATLRSLGSSGTTTRELAELSADRS